VKEPGRLQCRQEKTKETNTVNFTIDSDNNITSYDTEAAAQAAVNETTHAFSSQRELAKITAGWPASRLVEVWNSFAGTPGPFEKLKEVKKFTDRKTAVQRIWNVLHILSGDPTKDTEALQAYADAKKASQLAQEAAAATKHAKPKTGAKPASKKASKTGTEPRAGSKKAKVLDMMRRANGATLAEIQKATEWQAHTVRGFISIAAKKLSLKIESTKRENGDREYRIV
jgi:hypothetical protein